MPLTCPRKSYPVVPCVGHGGIPEYLVEQTPIPPRGLVYEYRRIHSSDWQPWNTFGFAIVDLDGDRMSVRYVDERGEQHWQHPTRGEVA